MLQIVWSDNNMSEVLNTDTGQSLVIHNDTVFKSVRDGKKVYGVYQFSDDDELYTMRYSPPDSFCNCVKFLKDNGNSTSSSKFLSLITMIPLGWKIFITNLDTLDVDIYMHDWSGRWVHNDVEIPQFLAQWELSVAFERRNVDVSIDLI